MRVESVNPGAGSHLPFPVGFRPRRLGPGGGTKFKPKGFVGTSSTPAFTTIFTLPSNGSWVNESFASEPLVNKLLLTPLDSSGNPYPCTSFSPGNGYFWMDDVTLTAVPEPSTWLRARCCCFPLDRKPCGSCARNCQRLNRVDFSNPAKGVGLGQRLLAF